jgi:hypothetical protein
MRKELRMADSETLLQLGIDAAREGRREDARNLFGLLTRQDPNNSQAWLWLAGVAEGPDQRRAALERVVELDPTNEMAVKGLQAMGVSPGAPAAGTTTAPPPPAPAPEPPPAPAREMTDEERYAAELDSAFDEDYASIPRAETPPRDLDDTAVIDGGTPPRTARERAAARRATTPIHSDEDDEDLYGPPPSRRPSNLLLGLLALIVLLLVGYLLYSLLFNRGQQTAGGDAAATAAAQATAVAGGTGIGTPTGEQPTAAQGGVTGPVTGTGGLTSTTTLTDTPPLTDTGTAGGQPTPAPGEQPPPGGGQVPAPQANPNLQPVGIGSTLEANGWTYTYPSANYAVVLGNQIGGSTASGTYLHVLVWVANNTGTAQPLPANFFALKDANNNVYTAVPQVSSAAVQRGINADLGMEDPVPANGVLTSVYLVFDVPPGTQGLTLFAAGNNGQGWPLGIVP